jgi:adenosylcobyric acid synthase
MAHAADARCLLVGDIDRGGVFAALLGTLELLDPDERARIAAFAINKFRGDPALLAPGIATIEERLGVPCAGVVPWLHDLGLDEEDSVALEDAPRVTARAWHANGAVRARPLRIAVVALPFLSNATDFAALAAEPDVDLAYASDPDELAHADVVVLPGTKETLADLRWLRANGIADATIAFAERGIVFGVCGGMQMLGERVADPLGVEGGGEERGLGLLPLATELERHKITEPVRVRPHPGGLFGTAPDAGDGYEIHVGRSQRAGGVAFAHLVRRDGVAIDDGAQSANGNVTGTYVHGLFANDALRHAFLRTARARAGLAAPSREIAYGAERDARFERLATHVRASLSSGVFEALLRG